MSAARGRRICPKCTSLHVEAIQAAVVQTLVCRKCGHLWSANQSDTTERCPDCNSVGVPTEVTSADGTSVQLRCPNCHKQWNRTTSQ